MNRIFISYRTVDGAKDASRLADDLGRVFGNDQVFLDRQDLRGGGSWRQQIGATMGARPVVLLLVTPGFIGARHPDGRPRIEDPDDPVRVEIESALAVGAALMPLRVDGTAMPRANELPAAIRPLSEHHALPLRTDDWTAQDLPRIVRDIERLGVARTDRTSWRAGRGRWRLALAACAGLALMGWGLLMPWLGDIDLPATAAGPSTAARAVPASAPSGAQPSLDGRWLLSSGNAEPVPVTLVHRGDRLKLLSEPVRIDNDPDWRSYLDTLASIDGPALTHIVFSAEGGIFGDRADLKVLVASADGSFLVDSGDLHLRIGREGKVLAGQVLLNSGEQDTVVLARQQQ